MAIVMRMPRLGSEGISSRLTRPGGKWNLDYKEPASACFKQKWGEDAGSKPASIYLRWSLMANAMEMGAGEIGEKNQGRGFAQTRSSISQRMQFN
jgi:hypothetical protein